MYFPKSVTDIANDCAAKHGADCETATQCAVSKIKRLPEYADMVDSLIWHAVQNLVYMARHRSNVSMRNNAGQYGGPAKVKSHESAALSQVAWSIYSYSIAGTMLGLLTGSQLPAIAESESAVASGHEFNARLCRRLAEIVPDDKLVKDVVSERKLRTIFKELSA